MKTTKGTAVVTGAANDIGQAYARRLAADDSGFVTGQTIAADGGQVRN